MLIRNKRQLVAQLMNGLGVLAAIERLSRRPGLLVLTYHRIGEPASSPLYDHVFSASPAAFVAQVQMVRERYHVVGLEEALAAVDKGFAFKRPTVLVTFDDGYRDNFDLALPILADLGVPATFFLPTSFLDQPALPWWDHVALIIKRTRQERFALELPEPVEIDMARDGIAGATAAIVRPLLAAGQFDEPAFFAHLHERADVPNETATIARDLFITWDQARKIISADMTIGSHSINHPRLALLAEAQQRAELAGSKERLEAELGREIVALAYPFGDATAFDTTTQQLAAEAGYRLAFTALPGVNRPGIVDRFAIARLNVGHADSPELLRARAALYASFGASRL